MSGASHLFPHKRKNISVVRAGRFYGDGTQRIVSAYDPPPATRLPRINSSPVQNRMPIAGKKRHIYEEGEADAEKVAGD